MKLLLDTHTLAWWLEDSPKLGPAARAAMLEDGNAIWVSAVSAMEVTTKYRLGKWPEAEWLALNFSDMLGEEGFSILPVTLDHAVLAGSMPIAHKDPFDRLLIAQARVEDMPFLSNEAMFDGFGVRRIW